MLKNIKRYILRYKFKRHGYSEITGEFGRYYTKPFSNVVLFIPAQYE